MTFPKAKSIRLTYAQTIEAHRKGFLSLGFLWELAERDAVFAAYLRRQGIEPLRDDEKGAA